MEYTGISVKKDELTLSVWDVTINNRDDLGGISWNFIIHINGIGKIMEYEWDINDIRNMTDMFLISLISHPYSIMFMRNGICFI